MSLAASFLAVAVSSAISLDYPGTCRGASAVVTDISGLDTTTARMTARHTYPDALAYCHYSLGSGVGKPSPRCGDGGLLCREFYGGLGAATHAPGGSKLPDRDTEHVRFKMVERL